MDISCFLNEVISALSLSGPGGDDDRQSTDVGRSPYGDSCSGRGLGGLNQGSPNFRLRNSEMVMLPRHVSRPKFLRYSTASK